MDNKTLTEFMQENTTMVEDLRIAAGLLPNKRAFLSESLKRYASELAKYNPFLSKEGGSPFATIKTMNEAVKDATPAWATQFEWEISPEGDLCHKKMNYHIYSNQLHEKNWILQMMEKGWCNLNAFIPAYLEACRRAGIKELTIITTY